MAAIGGRWHAGAGIVDPAKDLRYVYADQPGGELFLVAKVWANEDGQFADTARLVAAAPELLAALKQAVNALNVKERFRVGDTDSYAIASECDKAIRLAEGRGE